MPVSLYIFDELRGLAQIIDAFQ